MTRLLLAISIVAVIAVSMPIPVASADTWDYLVRYTISGDSTQFLMIGAVTYVMDCAAGWTTTTQSVSSSPSNSEIFTVYGSYTSGKIVLEDQKDGTTTRFTQSCPTLPGLTPALPADSAASGSAWYTIYDSAWRVAPQSAGFRTPQNYAGHSCYQIVSEIGTTSRVGSIPFTGNIAAYIDDQWGTHARWDSGYWIAGMGPQPLVLRTGYFPGNGLTGPKTCNSSPNAPWALGAYVLSDVAVYGMPAAGSWHVTWYACDPPSSC